MALSRTPPFRVWPLLDLPTRVGLGMLASVFGITWVQRQVLFPRHLVSVPLMARPAGLEELHLDTPQGPVEVWLLPGAGCTVSKPGPAVIFAHGNGELIDHWPEMLARYRDLGVTVILPEYRGYGRSAGRPSERAITADLVALRNRLSEHGSVDAERLVYHGRSLGGGAVCALLRHHPPRALVLESTFTSVADVARGFGVPPLLVKDRFDSRSALQGYAGPVLVIHGTRDEVVPTHHGQKLAQTARDAELVLYDAGHNDLPPPGTDYWERIEALLRRAGVCD